MRVVLTLRNALIFVATLLAVALGIESNWGGALVGALPDPIQPHGKRDTASVLPDFRLGSDSTTYAQIADRPLLSPSRRPAPTQQVAAAPEPPKPTIRRGLYTLLGITDLGNGRMAQVREVAVNRVRTVREGDQLQELTVKAVMATHVILAFQGEYDTLDLPKYTASGRVPLPPAAPAAQPMAAVAPVSAPAALQPVPRVGTATDERSLPSGVPPGAAALMERRRLALDAASAGQGNTTSQQPVRRSGGFGPGPPPP